MKNKETDKKLSSSKKVYAPPKYKKIAVTNTRPVTKHEKRRLLVDDFCESTSAHALPHIARVYNTKLRWIWFSLFVCAVVGNCIHLAIILSNYFSYPKQQNTFTRHVLVPFPDVTVCNIEAISGSNFDSMLQNKSSRTYKYHSFVQRLYRNGSTVPKERLASQMGHFENIGREEALKIGHKLNDFVLNSTFAGETCPGSNFKIFQDNAYYNCYTFRGEKYDISYGDGPRNGLSLILYLEELTASFARGLYNTHSPLENALGVRMVIHPPGTLPSLAEDGIDISPGHSTSAAVSVSSFTRLSNPHGECTTQENVCGEHNCFPRKFKYLPSTCTMLCLQQIVMQHCGCQSAYLVRPRINDSEPFCGKYNGNDAQYLNATDCARMAFRNSTKRVSQQEICQHCTEPCFQYEYSVVLSESAWPAPTYRKNFYNVYVKSRPDKDELKVFHQLKDVFERNSSADIETIVNRNFVRLNVFFKKMDIDEIMESPSYETGNLMSDIGGTIGLWAGLSFITVIEIIIFCGKYTKSIILSRSRSSKNNEIYEDLSNSHKI